VITWQALVSGAARLPERIAVACEDLQIAAIAVVCGLTLVSANAAFRRFGELTMVDWTSTG